MFINRLLPLISIILLFNNQTYAMLATAARIKQETAPTQARFLTNLTRQPLPKTSQLQQRLHKNRLGATRSFSSNSDGGGFLASLFWTACISIPPLAATMLVMTIDDQRRMYLRKKREEEALREENRKSEELWALQERWRKRREKETAEALAKGLPDPHAYNAYRGGRGARC